jgi:autotransporter-associated beta strand protein
MTYKWGPTLAVSMPVVLNGGTFGSGWPGPNGATFACPLTVSNNSTINFGGGYGNGTFSGNIAGSGGLTVTGDGGTRTFTGNNSYGWTTISAGVLKIGNAGTTGTLGLGPVTNNATLTFSRADSVAVTNRISGTGALVQSGAGTVSLFGTNTYTGGTTLAGGVLNVSAPETAGTSGPLGRSGTISFTGGTLQYSAVNAFDYSSRFSSATNQDVSIDTAGQNVTFATALTSIGGGSLTKLGTGTLTLAGANTYDTSTAVSAGTLAVTGSLKGGGPVTVSDGATLAVKANGATAVITNASSLIWGTSGATVFTVSNFTGNATAPVNVGTLTANGTVTVNVFGSPVAGQFPLIKYTGAIGGAGYGAFVLGSVPGNVTVSLSNNTANASVDLVVRPINVTLTYLAGTNGLISGVTPQVVSYNGSGTAVTAVPNTGYHFVNWSDGSTANPRTDTNVKSNITVTATFAINTYTLTYVAGTNGTISGNTPQTVNYGASGSAVTAVASAGYHFVNWSDGSTANPRTDANVTNNVSVTATFAINTLTLTYLAGSNGTISGLATQTVAYAGSGSAVSAVANSGYAFTNWSDGLTSNPRTDANVTNNLTVTANFVLVSAQPPVITSGPLLTAGGGVQFTFTGANGQAYRVLSSTDVSIPMTNWMVLTNGTFGQGPETFTDMTATNPAAFYRIVSP